MRYGFAIDHRTCIGCHACTVACKTEHQIPVGQFRTWVKYVDSGTFPDSTRDFGVMRCNHCTDAPCVEICPTSSLFKRDDGIVDFDSEICIGCKSCMQACPYDAIYIDKDTNTAAKCNFCAHRVDNGLEPACVTVCPTHSIWVGDLEDPASGISQLLAAHETTVRAPEQRTGPNVHYVGASDLVLDPLAAPVRDTYIWAQPDELRLLMAEDPYGADPTAATTLNTRMPGPGAGGSPPTSGPRASAPEPCSSRHWRCCSGSASTDRAASARCWRSWVRRSPAALLVWDLKRPERFYYLLTKGNPTSWLVKGGYCLMAIAAVSGVWLLAQLLSLDSPSAQRRAGSAEPARGGDGGRVHRVPVRAGRGPRPLAVPLAVPSSDRAGPDGRCRRDCRRCRSGAVRRSGRPLWWLGCWSSPRSRRWRSSLVELLGPPRHAGRHPGRPDPHQGQVRPHLLGPDRGLGAADRRTRRRRLERGRRVPAVRRRRRDPRPGVDPRATSSASSGPARRCRCHDRARAARRHARTRACATSRPRRSGTASSRTTPKPTRARSNASSC